MELALDGETTLPSGEKKNFIQFLTNRMQIEHFSSSRCQDTQMLYTTHRNIVKNWNEH